MKYFNVYDSYMIYFFSRYSRNHKKTSSRPPGGAVQFHRRDVFSARSRNDVGATKEAAQREGGKKGKAGKLSNGTEAKQPRDIHLMWQPCIYSHLSELCKWLLLGIKKFPSEKLALDDFGKALKSILADATEHWAD